MCDLKDNLNTETAEVVEVAIEMQIVKEVEIAIWVEVQKES